MFGLFFSLVLLGLSAIDPVGIAAMPILLSQKNPYMRSFVFVAGSFASLMLLGVVFARGFGVLILNYEKSNAWFVPSVEAVSGVILLGIAAVLIWRTKNGTASPALSSFMLRRLELGNVQLLVVGAVLVAVQSVLDVVFVVAMVHIGQLHMNFLSLTLYTATYAFSALVLQISVVLAYALASAKRRTEVLHSVQRMLARYATQALIVISLVLGSVLLLIAS